MTEEQKLALDEISSELDIEEGKRRYCSVEESIRKSLREIKQFKEGKKQFKTLEESQALWDLWAEEVDKKIIEDLTIVDLMLSSKRREEYYKYWDNKLAEDRQNQKLKEVFEEEDKIYKDMRELEKDKYKKWEEE